MVKTITKLLDIHELLSDPILFLKLKVRIEMLEPNEHTERFHTDVCTLLHILKSIAK